MEVKSFVFKFDDVEVREREFSLIKAGKVLNVEPKAFRALVFLLRNPQKLISKEEILNTVWGDAAVTEGSLTRCIWHLRSVLGDDIRSPRYIETVATVGYRFLCDVQVLEDGFVASRSAEASNPATTQTTKPVRSATRGWRFAVIVAIGACSVVVVVLGWLWSSQHRRAPAAPTVKLIPLTSYPGIEQQPSLSPDGSQVAFSWNGPDQANFDIYIKTTGVETAGAVPLRLTTDLADDINPAWSPDGSSIAFLRRVNPENEFKVLLIPALGGPERNLAEVSIPDTGWLYPPYLSWTPDSQSLVITDRPSVERPTALYLLSVRTREKRQLTFPPPGVLGDHCAAVSPDGKALAFRRANVGGQWGGSLYLLGLDDEFKPGGEPRQITPEPGLNHSFDWSCVAWTADSQRLIYPYDLGLSTVPVSIEGANPLRDHATMVIKTGNGVNMPTASRASGRLAFALVSGGGQSIWRMRIPGPHEKPEPPVRLIPSNTSEFSQQYSPDGSKIAFESALSGNLEIWICSSEGQNCAQLTSLGALGTGLPTWSPDGKQIAFYSNVDGTAQIYVIPAEGGATRRFTSDSWGGMFPRWSRNGEWIYFSSKKSGSSQIWKTRASGGTAVQVTHSGGLVSSESPDGKWLYFAGEGTDASLWKVPVAGGNETQILPSVTRWNYAIMSDGVYFVTRTGHGFAIEFLNLAAGKTEVVAPIRDGYYGFSISPDRKWILYTQEIPLSSELILAEGFR